jgi:hypothetical protein
MLPLFHIIGELGFTSQFLNSERFETDLHEGICSFWPSAGAFHSFKVSLVYVQQQQGNVCDNLFLSPCFILNCLVCRIYPLIFIPALLLHILKLEKKRKVGFLTSTNLEKYSKKTSTSWGESFTRKRTIYLMPAFLSTLLKVDPHICSIEYSSESFYYATRFFNLLYILDLVQLLFC